MCRQLYRFLKKMTCLCAFDIDQTLTCGDPAAEAARRCRDLGCATAIVTARPAPVLVGIPDNVLDAVLPLARFEYNPRSLFQDEAERAATKAVQLGGLAAEYDHVMFFDDLPANVTAAKQQLPVDGFGAELVVGCEWGHLFDRAAAAAGID